MQIPRSTPTRRTWPASKVELRCGVWSSRSPLPCPGWCGRCCGRSASSCRIPLVALMAFTPYAALSSPVPVVVALLLRRWADRGAGGRGVLALLGVASCRGRWPGREPEANGPRLVVMTSNLWLGQADAEAVLRIAREHDVDVLERAGAAAEADAAVRARGRGRAVPGAGARPARGRGGQGVLSRLPLRGGRHVAQPPGHAEPEVELTVPGAPPVRIKAVHPRAAGEPRRRRRLAATRSPRCPASDGRGDVQILAGDFNATLDHRSSARLLDRGYIDAADAVGAGLATGPGPARRARPRAPADDRPRAGRPPRRGRAGHRRPHPGQ